MDGKVTAWNGGTEKQSWELGIAAVTVGVGKMMQGGRK